MRSRDVIRHSQAHRQLSHNVRDGSSNAIKTYINISLQPATRLSNLQNVYLSLRKSTQYSQIHLFVGQNSQQSDFNGIWSGQVSGIIPESSQKIYGQQNPQLPLFYHFLPLWFSVYKSCFEYPRRFQFEAVCLKNKEEQLSLKQLFQKIII